MEKIPVPGSASVNPEVVVEIMTMMEGVIESREPGFDPGSPEMAVIMSHYATSVAALITSSVSAGAENPRRFVKEAARSFQDNIRKWKARDLEIQRETRGRKKEGTSAAE